MCGHPIPTPSCWCNHDGPRAYSSPRGFLPMLIGFSICIVWISYTEMTTMMRSVSYAQSDPINGHCRYKLKGQMVRY